MFWCDLWYGESDEDIIDMAFTLNQLDADSIPVNFLHPIKVQNLAVWMT